jgi:hypothetical protein
MKGPNQYSGQSLNNQTAGAFTDALGIAGNQVGAGAQFGQQGMDWLGSAAGGFGSAAGMTPTDISAGQLATTDLTPYKNPFQQDVIDTTMDELNRQEVLGRQRIGDEAMAAGAWGGDRQAVESAENRRNFNTQRMGILSQLNQANFNNAMGMANTDIGRKFGADQANQGMRMGMSQFGTQGMAGLGRDAMSAGMSWYDPSKLAALSGQGFGMADTIAKNNLQAGSLQQQNLQSIIDAAKLGWEQFQNKPIQGLAAITGSTQIPSGGTTTTTNKPGSLGILGAGISGLGALMGMSDRNMKTDITPLGKDPELGIPMYAYRYKGDPKHYPKVVGPMAQDIAKKFPGMTKKIAGKLAVSNDIMERAMRARRRYVAA